MICLTCGRYITGDRELEEATGGLCQCPGRRQEREAPPGKGEGRAVRHYDVVGHSGGFSGEASDSCRSERGK